MTQVFTSLGLMTGTSADGLDISLIKSDGESFYDEIKDSYFDYDDKIRNNYNLLREKVFNKKDLTRYKKEIEKLEREITLFHADCIKKFSEENTNHKIDLIGFHGQTIYHNAHEKITRQLGNGDLLSQLLKKTVINNFREMDLMANGQGAPLAPIFHEILIKKLKIGGTVVILNIGGISNITVIDKKKNNLFSTDLGPGNCLIDSWIRKKSKYKFDKDGIIAHQGQINKIIYEQAIDQWYYKISSNINKNQSFDINDFDLSFVRGLTLADGSATLTEYTSEIISKFLNSLDYNNIIVCGGGRKNNFLINRISSKIDKKLTLIDDLGVNGDFIESKAFAYLAIRSLKKLPFTFPETTGCSEATSGGTLYKFI